MTGIAHRTPGQATATVATVDDYVALMRAFLTNLISASEFERQYLDLFRDDATERPEPTFRALNDLFFDVDAFCPDPTLRDPEDLGEDELRASVQATVDKLSA